MKRWSLLLVASTLMFAFLVGCAHRSYVRDGDRAMAAGSYEEALDNYQRALQYKPKNRRIAVKVEEAEEAAFGASLREIEDALEAGDIEGAIWTGHRVSRLIVDPVRLDAVEEAVEAGVLRVGWALVYSGEYGEALRLVGVHIEAFGDPLEPIGELDEEIRSRWEEELRRRGRERLEEGLHGAAALFFTKADEIGLRGDGGAAAQQALQRVYHFDGWGVLASVNVEGRGETAVLERVFGFDELSRAIVDARRSDGFGIEGHLRVVVGAQRFEQWDEEELRSGEYQSGTRLVPNPTFVAKDEELLEAQRAEIQAEQDYRDAVRRLRDAERNLDERRRRGQATGTQENRVQRELQNADRREAEWERASARVRQLDMEVRRIPAQMEEPVYSEHVYQVVVQRARLSADLRLEISVPGKEFEHIQEVDLHIEDARTRHLAQPVLDLPAASPPAPSERQVREQLYVEVGERAGEFLVEAFTTYRFRDVGDLSRMEERRKIDRLARFILLDPQQRDRHMEDELAELSGLEDGASLLLQLPYREVTLR